MTRSKSVMELMPSSAISHRPVIVLPSSLIDAVKRLGLDVR
jgi:hypothetical protein